MFQQTLINAVNQPYQHPTSTLVHSQDLVNTAGNVYSRSRSRGSLQPPLTSMENLPIPTSGIALPQHLPLPSSSSTGSTSPEHLPPTPPASAFLDAQSHDQHTEDPTNQSSLPDLSYTAGSVEVPYDRNTGNSTALLKQTPVNELVNEPFNNPSATPAPSYDSLPKSGPDALKRTSVDMSGDPNEGEAQHRKKPRLDGQEHGAAQVEGQVAISDTGMEVNDISRNEEDEDSDDGVIEIGPDGLRLEDDCMAALIEEVGEDGDLKVCKLCK